MTRSVWWPRFHDTSYAPRLREQIALHWRANLLMLRSVRAVSGFFAITLAPLGFLILVWLMMDRAAGARSWFIDSDSGLLTAVAILVGFALVQHLAFVQAMNRTYGPFVREAMWARGTAVCRQCGHLLSPERIPERCSECGEAP